MQLCACGCGQETPVAERNWPSKGIRKGDPRKYVAGHNARRASLDDRFWSRVDRSGDCWLWTGAKDHRGYGRLQRGARSEGHVKAHRLSYELHHGPIPEGMFVCHRCDNPSCVNPAHLFLGSHDDNMADMDSKGRRRGRPLAVDPDALVALIQSGASYQDAAERFGVPRTTVYRTLKRRGLTRTYQRHR